MIWEFCLGCGVEIFVTHISEKLQDEVYVQAKNKKKELKSS